MATVEKYMFALKIDSENNFCNIELTDNVLN